MQNTEDEIEGLSAAEADPADFQIQSDQIQFVGCKRHNVFIN